MSAKTKFIGINLIGLALALVFFFGAREPFIFQLMGSETGGTPGALILMSYVCGALLGGLSMLPFARGKQQENVAKLKEWQTQDAKLALEVQSDREKQLEAKIATLETALKQALKK